MHICLPYRSSVSRLYTLHLEVCEAKAGRQNLERYDPSLGLNLETRLTECFSFYSNNQEDFEYVWGLHWYRQIISTDSHIDIHL